MKRNGTGRLLAGLLALIMVLVLLPVGAAKAADEGYLTVGGTAIDLSQNGSYCDGKVVFEIIDGKNVLTLNGYKLENYNGDGIYANRIDLTIVGSAGIGVTDAFAIYVNDGNLTLNGDFTLRANTQGNMTIAVSGYLTVEGGKLDVENTAEGRMSIFVIHGMTVNGGTVHAKANNERAIMSPTDIILNNGERFLLGDASASEVFIGKQYPLRVGNKQVNDLNKGDIFGDGTAKFEIIDGRNVLTLNDWKLENFDDDGIYADRIDLTIVGSAEIGVTGATKDAIYVNKGNLTLNGDFTLRAQSETGATLDVYGYLTVEGGALDVENTDEGSETIYVNGAMTVNGGTVHAKANGTNAIEAIYGIILNNGEQYLLGDANAYEVKIGVPVEYTITFVNEDGTELQSGEVLLGKTPAYTGEEPEKPATVTQSYAFAGWKDENGIVYGLTDDLPAVTGAMTYTAIYTQREIVYGEPEWTWTGYESAEATFTGTDGETLYTQLLPAGEITHMTTVEPDCENPGIVTYTASVIFLGKTYYNNKNKEIAPRGHEWVFDEFVWQKNAQGVYYALAQFHCTRVESHTLTVTPVGGMATDPATCTEDGCEHYVAFLNEFESPDGQYHEDKLEVVIPAHGHWWSEPDLERTKTETGYQVTATIRCLYDYSHQISETVDAVCEIITPPTLTEEGLCKYTATFTDPHLHSIWWTEPIPMLALGLYGEDVDALDVVEHTGDGETLYRYDVMLRNDAEVLPIASVQMFIAYDDALTFVEAKTELHDAVIQDGNGVIALAWATDEGVMMENGTVVASLYFKLTGDVPNGGVLPFRFVEKNGNQSTVSYLADGTPVEAAAFETVDGSIVFAIPDAITIAGEDVLSGDIYTIEDGRILYRYNIRVRDLPEAGLWINSAQIFVSFDHAVLSVAKTEGMLDWTTSESGDKLMAVWASDEDVQISEGDVVLTVWFEKIGEASDDGVVPITFTTNLMGNASAASITFCGAVAEIAADTVDGSITFEPILYGDANCDGEITAADAALILRAIVGLSELTPRGVLNADANGDLEITAEDAALILRYVVGLIGSLPA